MGCKAQRYYPCERMYWRVVLGDASPIEQTKYPSLQKVGSFQNQFFDKIILCFWQIAIVLSCLSLRTIMVIERRGMYRMRKCTWWASVSITSISKSDLIRHFIKNIILRRK